MILELAGGSGKGEYIQRIFTCMEFIKQAFGEFDKCHIK